MLERNRAKLDRLEADARPATDRMARYRNDPVGYARDILKANLTDDQIVIARSLLKPPYKSKVKAGHSVGKTYLEACIANWWYDTRNPSVVLSTAPTDRDVKELLWTEIRIQRRRAGLQCDFIGPSAAEMRTGDEHWAKGYTARESVSFQGRHRESMLFLFDEDEGIERDFWTATKTMHIPDGQHAWLSIGNPTTTATQSYLEEQAVGDAGEPAWNLFTLSCLTHPNILAELQGERPPIPTAVRMSQVKGWIAEWCTLRGDGEPMPTDVEFPPGSGKWYRPNNIFEARCLGRRPTQGTDTIWSEALFDAAVNAKLRWAIEDRPEIGVDVARFGDDWTAIHTRCGPVSLRHETGNGWSVAAVVARVEAEAGRASKWSHGERPDERYTPFDVAIKVDDAGVGGGVTDILRERGYWVSAINAGGRASRMDLYPLVRDQLWFEVAGRAAHGLLSFAMLPKDVVARLRPQALSPTYDVVMGGRRQVEAKHQTKERIGRSPDDMDAVNLAYAPTSGGVPILLGGDE